MADDGISLRDAIGLDRNGRLDLATAAEFRLGALRVRPAYREIRRGEDVEILEPRVMQVLVALQRRAGAVVSREELLRDCWGDLAVSDDSLHRCIGRLRKLADADDGASFRIDTVARVGYRLVAGDAQEDAPAAVAEPAAQPTPAAPARHDRRRPLAMGLAGALLLLLAAAAGWRLTRPETWAVSSVENLLDTSASERHPSLASSGALLAYASGPAFGPSDIHLRNLSDASDAALVAGPEDDRNPTLSPAGDRLAFVRARSGAPCEILIKPLPDGVPRPLARCRGDAWANLAWSPDGRSMLFTDQPGPNQPRAIYAVAADGGAPRRISDPGAGVLGDSLPAVSPDGARLAFVRWRTTGASDVFVQDLRSGRLRQLTHDQVEVLGLAWSDTGRSLFFTSNRSGDYAVWSIPPRGGTPRRLSAGLREVRRLSFAKGGMLVAEIAELRGNLALAGRAGPTLTDEAGVQWGGDVSPAGDLAYVEDSRAGRAVWIQPKAGPRRRVSFMRATHMDDVRWSPDGARLAFIAVSAGRWAIYEVDARGGALRTVLSGDDQMGSLSWSPDGGHLLFGMKRGGTWRIWRTPRSGGAAPEPVTGPGWRAARLTTAGLLAVKADVPEVWRLSAGAPPKRIVTGLGAAPNGWTVAGDRQYWLSSGGAGTPARVMSAGLDGSGLRTEGEAPDAPRFTGLTVDPASGDIIYTRIERADTDLALLRVSRGD